MKKRWIVFIMILEISFIRLSASAQDLKSESKVKFEFGIGVNCSGPQQQMADLMKKYRYNDTQKFWLKIFTNKDYISYPIYSDVGFNTYISLCYRIAPKSQVGLRLNYSGFGQVSGYSTQYGYLDIHLASFSVIPIYTFEVNEVLEIQAGPALMINSGDNKSVGSELNNEQYTQHSLGLFTGLNLRIWDRQMTFGKIGMNYLLNKDCDMGPYTSDSYNDSHMIPESALNFSHLNFVFAFGLNL
jgi:hypothetical protein